MYQRKTIDEWQLHINYGYGNGWEHEMSENTFQEARERIREYRENCPQYPVKLICKRIKQEARP